MAPPRMTTDRQRPALGGIELLGLGIFNGVCLAAGLALGWFADREFGSSPICTIIGLLAGLVAGVVGTWVQLKRYIDADRST
jgi:F0F1-type ATP synthase assembly protein I